MSKSRRRGDAVSFSDISDTELRAMYQHSLGGIRYSDAEDDDGNAYKEVDMKQFTKHNATSSDRHSLARGWEKSGLVSGRYQGADEQSINHAFTQVREEYNKRQTAKDSASSAKTASLEKRLKELEANKAAAAPKPKGPLAIDPVKESPGISAARGIVDSYQAGLKDQKSPWEEAQANANSSSFGTQNQTDFTAQFNPSGSDDTPQMSQETTDMKNKAQDFADKYKLDLISSGATKNQFSS